MPTLATAIAGLQTKLLGASDEALLQRFFDDNPAYFLAIQGEPAGPAEARDEIHSLPPADWPFTKKWLIGAVDDEGRLVAFTNILSDLLAPGAWHIGLFIVATAWQGRGLAPALYRELEAWASASGAEWLRLGVVEGNTRAERFWAGRGFVSVRKRGGYRMGRRTNVVCTMFKPLSGGTLADYLALVERDRPEPA
jgi:ribosomal protein S18 acetylase RimI-like enzyme